MARGAPASNAVKPADASAASPWPELFGCGWAHADWVTTGHLPRRDAVPMTDDLIKPEETAYTLRLTTHELKLVYTALKIYYDDLGHEEDAIEGVVESIFRKLPSKEEIAAIDLNLRR